LSCCLLQRWPMERADTASVDPTRYPAPPIPIAPYREPWSKEQVWLLAMSYQQIAALVLAMVTIFIGFATLMQKLYADRRDQWWKRAQWAVDNVSAPDDLTRALGLTVLISLYDSPLATNDERNMIESIADAIGDSEAGAARND
jgi:hypothetical protein